MQWGRVRDVARLALQYRTPKKMLAALENLSTGDMEIVKFENRFNVPTVLGWMDVTLLIQIAVEGGRKHIAEVQMQLIDFAEAREHAHHHYEEMRVLLPNVCGVHVKDLDRVQQVLLDVFRGGGAKECKSG